MCVDQFDERRADDDTVGDAADRGRLIGRADAEADRDGQIGCRLKMGDGRFDAGLRRLLQSGDAGDRDIIEETRRAFENRRQPLCIGGRGGEADQVDAGVAQRGACLLYTSRCV